MFRLLGDYSIGFVRFYLKDILRSLITNDINTALICTALIVPVLKNELEPFFVELSNRSWCLEGSHLTFLNYSLITRSLVVISQYAALILIGVLITVFAVRSPVRVMMIFIVVVLTSASV